MGGVMLLLGVDEGLPLVTVSGPGMLDANPPLLNLLTAELLNGTVGLLLGSEVDEGETDSLAGARVGGNGGGLAARFKDQSTSAVVFTSPERRQEGDKFNLHGKSLEELLQLLISGRVGEISDVEPPALSSGLGVGSIGLGGIRLLSSSTRLEFDLSLGSGLNGLVGLVVLVLRFNLGLDLGLGRGRGGGIGEDRCVDSFGDSFNRRRNNLLSFLDLLLDGSGG